MPSADPTQGVGIDFGTTNSSVAVVGPDGRARLAQFSFMGTLVDASRSLLYFEPPPRPRVVEPLCWTGPAGIERYLAAETKGRLVQSLKSFLTSRDLKNTAVFGRRRTIESLIARIVGDLRDAASRQFGFEIVEATVGRPVQFVGAANEDDNVHAEARLREAFAQAGFERVRLEFEPVGAAYHYASRLDHAELILIGDFGGGTSDFSLLRVGPGAPGSVHAADGLIGAAGVGLAGDAFDAQIVRHLVSPALGSRTMIRSWNQQLPVPSWPYASLERWHHLSFLKTREVMAMLANVAADAVEPERIQSLIYLIENDLGFQLHRSVQQLKSDLSREPIGTFLFDDGDLRIESQVTRWEFERWIGDELHQLETCVDGLLQRTGVSPAEVDAVFLTGGTSFVPAVRRIFTSRFGDERIHTGGEFTSVALGLALTAASQPAPSP